MRDFGIQSRLQQTMAEAGLQEQTQDLFQSRDPWKPQTSERVNQMVADWHNRVKPPAHPASWGESLVHELVKSYGFRYDDNTGKWGWAIGNIATAYEEDPVWTAIDHALLALPPLRFALSAGKIKSGVKAIKAGKEGIVPGGALAKALADEGAETVLSKARAKTWTGRTFTKLGMDPELARATEMRLAGPSPMWSKLHAYTETLDPHKQYTKVLQGVAKAGEFVSHPMSIHIDEDYMGLIKKYGADPFEKRGIFLNLRREQVLEANAGMRTAYNLQARLLKLGLDEDGQKKWMESFATGERVAGLTDEAYETAQASRAFRQQLHLDMHDLGLISDKAAERYYQKWAPRIYAKWVAINRDVKALGIERISGTKAHARAGSEAIDRLKKRTLSEEAASVYDNMIMSPELTLEQLGSLTALVSRQRFAQKLSKSVISMGRDEVDTLIGRFIDIRTGDLVEGWEKAALLHGVGPWRVKKLQELVHNQLGLGGKKKRVLHTEVADIKKARKEARIAQQKAAGATDPMGRTGREILDEADLVDEGDLYETAEEAAARENRKEAIRARKKSERKALRKRGGLPAADAEKLHVVRPTSTKVGPEGVTYAEALGWRKIEHLYSEVGREVPSYVKHLPNEFKNKYIDPTVANDIVGMMSLLGKDGWVKNFYKGSMRVFRASKTAYHPPTIIRNFFGAMVMHHLTTGGVPTLLPVRGIKAYLEGTRGKPNKYYQLYHDSGRLGAGASAELRDTLDEVAAGTYKFRGSALDVFGDSRFAKYIQRGASRAEEFYRTIDDVWKLDAFIQNMDKYGKKGSHVEAIARGELEQMMDLSTIPVYVPAFKQGQYTFQSMKGARTHREMLDEFFQGIHYRYPPKRPGAPAGSTESSMFKTPQHNAYTWGTMTGYMDRGAPVSKGWVDVRTGEWIADSSEGITDVARFDQWLDDVTEPDFIRDASMVSEGKLQERLGRKTREQWVEDRVKQLSYEESIRDLDKFTANFISHSPLTEGLRPWVPFISFTTESMRIWKNAIIEKPHIAFFWNHMAETFSSFAAGMAGYTPQELQESKDALPYYMEGKKLLALPFNVDNKIKFVDLSYIIPLGNIVEAENAENLFFLTPIIDPMANPALGLATAISVGQDPFSGREIEPRFTERQLGIPVQSPLMRRTLGVGEYALNLFLPPLIPPGYAGTNLLEAVRGQKNPSTGLGLEAGVFESIAANVFAMRTYAPTVESQILNIKREQKVLNKEVSKAWRRWEFAAANNDIEAMRDEQARIINLKQDGGEDGPAYFESVVKRHVPTSFSTLSRKQKVEVLERSRRMGGLSPEDEEILETLKRRL